MRIKSLFIRFVFFVSFALAAWPQIASAPSAVSAVKISADQAREEIAYAEEVK